MTPKEALINIIKLNIRKIKNSEKILNEIYKFNDGEILNDRIAHTSDFKLVTDNEPQTILTDLELKIILKINDLDILQESDELYIDNFKFSYNDFINYLKNNDLDSIVIVKIDNTQQNYFYTRTNEDSVNITRKIIKFTTSESKECFFMSPCSVYNLYTDLNTGPFYNDIDYNSVNEVLPFTYNIKGLICFEQISNNFFIKNRPEGEILFKCFNRKKLFDYLKVFGFSYYYKTEEEALMNTNKIFFEDTPSPAPEPEIPTTTPDQTAPGQGNNEIINNGGGTGDSSSTIIIKPINPAGTAGGLTNSYILNYKEILKIQGELYKPSFIKSLNALNFNLQETILSLMIYPFNIIENSSYSSVSNKTVRLGEYDVVMDYDVFKIAPSSVGKFKVGEISIKPYFGNFLDFSSTAMKIYLPYLGFYEIDPFDVYTNTKLTVYYTVEFETGRVKATIENDSGNIINYYSGQIGIQLSFVGSNFGEIMKNVVFSTITGGITSTFGGFKAGAEKVLNSEMTHTGGTDGSSLERFMPQKPYLMVMHPDTVIPTNYNKTVGRPSLITITLNKIKGYTEVENPILNIPGATETEINEIVSIMKNGFRIQ